MNKCRMKALFVVAVFFLACGLYGQQKYALVIGNAAYTSIGALKNPINDAEQMKTALESLGFSVELVKNGNLETMETAVTRLGTNLHRFPGSYGFFYYAGHGVQSGGQNYFIPVNAAVRTEARLRYETMSLQYVLEELQSAKNALNMVVLDACRDNPFQWARSDVRGLSMMAYQPPGSIVVYATSAGSTAADGEGGNGIFTGELLKQLKIPGLEVKDLFNRTAAAVQRVSGYKQNPAVYLQFFEDAWLGAASVQPAPSAQAALIAPPETWTPASDFDLGLEENGLTITRYKGNAAVVNIPASVDDIPVTAIGDNAFNGHSSLTSISIPDSVTNIGSSAFSGCSKLTAITVDAGNRHYTSVNGILFSKDGKTIHRYPAGKVFTSYTIPNSVTSIGDVAFSGCSSLTSISIPNSVTNIGDRAFYDCSSLTSISIPNSVTGIGHGAFYDCSSLTSISIPNSVTNIGDRAFYDCSSLTSISIPNSVTNIRDGVFSSCSSLTSISIPNSVTNIGTAAFQGCSSLTSISIPNSVTNIEYAAFYGCSKLTAITVDAGNRHYASITGILFSKDGKTIHSYPAGKVFTSYTIPNSVTTIGYYAFSSCSSLTSISIPNSVTNIGYGAFSSCSSLTSISIPNSVTNIGYEAFYRCSSLTSISIPNSVTNIEQWAFSSCSSLTSISIPNSVTNIGDGSFFGCSSLTSISIPNSVTNIGDEAFSGCSSLTSINIPASVTVIGWAAFSGCSSLTSISIPNSVTNIGQWAFASCSSLRSISIPNSVTNIGNEAFYGCSNLSAADREAILKRFGDVF